MILTPNQVEELLKIIDHNHLVFIGENLGTEYLSTSDKEILSNSGIDINDLYLPENDALLTSFHLGLLSDALRDNINTLSYDDLKNYIKGGHYIPLTQTEKYVLNIVKNQALKDIKTLKGNIFNDVNQILVDKSLEGQRKFLREEQAKGLYDKKSVKQIANDIARKTGDWTRNFDRIVEYNCQSAFEGGKAEYIANTYGEDSLVYKSVFEGACKHCVALYLTKGVGSEPRIFKLSELISNGTNIGRKTAEWKPVVGPIHCFCRCLLHPYNTGNQWNVKSKSFDIITPSKRIRPKVELTIGDKKYWV
jgi:hypothetical protein